MTDDKRLLSLLKETLDELPNIAPNRLLTAVLDDVRTARQARRPPWPSIRDWRSVASGWSGRRFTAAALVVAVAAIGFSQLVPRAGYPEPAAAPSPSGMEPSPTASASRSALADGSLAIEGAPGELFPGPIYTSSRFEPGITFEVQSAAVEGTAESRWEWCPVPYTSTRTIVLQHRRGCVEDLRIIRPYEVECGTADAHPDAATLAAAILARPGLAAEELGTVQSTGTSLPNLFSGSRDGRVIQIPGTSRSFDAKASDPDRCRLLPEPGTKDPVIELRGDLTAMLVLADVGGELIVVRAALGGHDATTGATARSRGYGDYGPEGLLHLLRAVKNLSFE